MSKRFQVRVDLWVDAPDKEAAEQRLRSLLNRLVVDGLGTVDCERRYPVNLSHWKLRKARLVRARKEDGQG